MAQWRTATNLCRRYQVSIERLNTYAWRGNLPKMTDSDGVVCFDEDHVRMFFRLRRADLALPVENLGVIGEARLGQTAVSKSNYAPAYARQQREVTVEPMVPRRLTGT
ncbi:MAG TPA: hypothetical protein VHM70_21875 [Polyangiaceae bacterium]|jgi:hypothetical protein|nr:hypothetical protein [Polyangiaceae bacterium]